MADLDDALKSMQDAESGYDKAKAYSDGPVEEVFTSRRVRRLLRDQGVSFETLHGNVVINAVANKLRIESITSDTDARTKMIADADEDNHMAQIRPEVMRRALQLGDGYLMAWPRLDENGDVVTGKVQISVHGPKTMRVIYAEDGAERFAVQKWAITTPLGEKRTRVDLIYADRIEHLISKGARASKAGDFQPYEADGVDAVEDNPYGELPVFHFRASGLPGEYGTPEHQCFYGTQNKLLKLEISHMAGVDYNTLPQRVALRDAGKVGPSDIDELDEDEFLASPDGQRTDSAMGDRRAKLSSEPGSVWDLEGYKDVKQLDPTTPAVFLDPREAYLREGALVSSTPLHMFDRTGQIPSGESLKTANEPLDDKSRAHKTIFDGTWRAFYRFVLKLLGQDDTPVSIAWAPIESTDETTKLSQAKQKEELGVPLDQALTELGYKAEDVKRWLDEGDGGLSVRVGLLAQLGDAVANFATAVAGGLMDAASVQAVIAKMIGDVTGPSDDGTG